ncbi:DUF480 domain-containing protein [Desertimonas flava]|uniref:DUF480 domain-containing protein n=1 Tax=Desertimonas flava TaxID=2064846 RepID=UPI0013C503CF|nr:DUF480 domain-containing protein [Desertimonas flava]
MELSGPQIRVLASLIEKEAAVPDSYPLTLTALRLACNQATNRRPVVSYDDRTVENALVELKSVGLVRFVHPSHGGRTTRYRHTAGERWRLSPGELLTLSALALRGPQTANDVRSRIERLVPADETSSVEAMLDTLAARSPEPFAARIGRRPGEREDRWVALLSGPLDESAVSALDSVELDDSTADLPRTFARAGRPDSDGAAAPAPIASPASPPPPAIDVAALAERVEQLASVIGAVASRLERLERELGVGAPHSD